MAANTQINFYLRYPVTPKHPERKNLESPIIAVVTWERNRFKANIGKKILPGNWNANKQEAKTGYSAIKDIEKRKELENEAQTINEIIPVIKQHINSIFTAYIKKNKPLPTLNQFSMDFKGRSMGVNMTLLEFIKKEIPKKKYTLRNTKKEYPISEGTLRSYTQILKLLELFKEEYKMKSLDFGDITTGFYTNFRTWMETRKVRARKDNSNTIGGKYEFGHTANFIGKMINNLKAIMNYAVQQGLTTNMDFKQFATPKDESILFTYLTVDELNQMWTLKFEESERKNLEVARDLFLISAWTGLRSSDVEAFNENAVINDDETITVLTQKTRTKVDIFKHPVVMAILEKYNGELPRMRNQLVNRYIKRVAQRMEGFDKPMKLTRTEGGTDVDRKLMRWEMVSTHTARRSFATNMYTHYQEDAATIMQITGHKKIKTFEQYINITKKQAALKLGAKITAMDATG